MKGMALLLAETLMEVRAFLILKINLRNVLRYFPRQGKHHRGSKFFSLININV